MLKQIQKFWWVPIPFCLSAVIWSRFQPETIPPDPRYPVVVEMKVPNGRTIDLERADSPEQQIIGMKQRDKKTFPDNRGMLYPLRGRQSPYSISMKDISFPLDFVFFDLGMVVSSFRLEPCTTNECPEKKVFPDSTHFIMLNAGIGDQLDLRPGQRVELKPKAK